MIFLNTDGMPIHKEMEHVVSSNFYLIRSSLESDPQSVNKLSYSGWTLIYREFKNFITFCVMDEEMFSSYSQVDNTESNLAILKHSRSLDDIIRRRELLTRKEGLCQFVFHLDKENRRVTYDHWVGRRFVSEQETIMIFRKNKLKSKIQSL